MKKKISLFLVGMLCFGLFTGCSSDKTTVGTDDKTEAGKTYEIKVGHGSAELTALHQGWLEFKKIVEEKSDGKIKVEIFPNQQLGGDRELVEAVQLGNVTMTSPSTAPLAAFDSKFFALDLPFLFKDREQVYTVLDGPVGKELLGSLDEFKIKGLAYWENGFRNFTNNKREVRTPADLKGLKIRTMENEIHMAAWKLLGANPTPMAFGELYTALQQGTVDGQENPFELIYATKFYEVQKYVTKTQHIYSAYVPLINLDFYNNLPSEYQTIITDAIKESTIKQRQVATDNDVAFEAKMKETNEIIDLTTEEKQAFSDAMAPVVELVNKKAGAEITDKFIKATKE